MEQLKQAAERRRQPCTSRPPIGAATVARPAANSSPTVRSLHVRCVPSRWRVGACDASAATAAPPPRRSDLSTLRLHPLLRPSPMPFLWPSYGLPMAFRIVLCFFLCRRKSILPLFCRSVACAATQNAAAEQRQNGRITVYNWVLHKCLYGILAAPVIVEG